MKIDIKQLNDSWIFTCPDCGRTTGNDYPIKECRCACGKRWAIFEIKGEK